GTVSVFRMAEVKGEFKAVMEEHYAQVKGLNEIKSGNAFVSQALRNMLIQTDADYMKAQFAEIDVVSKRTSIFIDAFEKSLGDAAGKAEFEKLKQARAAYRGPRDRLIKEIQASDPEAGKRTLMKDVTPRQVDYMAAVDSAVKYQGGLMDQAASRVEASVESTKLIVALIAAAACALGGLIAFFIIRATTRPINEAASVARAVANGDLTVEFDATGTNETGLLFAALHDMKTRLAHIVGGVRTGAEGVATASAEIAAGNNDLSVRTEQQASALEQTAASMEELSSTVKLNADNARQGNQLAVSASTIAIKGGETVAKVVDTMKGINDSSRQIVNIIGVIDSIAFQTNILALNAAVEAARAGEQGRGFAVVAAEVRSLAQRSSEAAKEIKSLISTSVDRVEQGTALVDDAGVTMGEVVASIRRVTDIMGEISAASIEQSSGVSQVGEAVTQMDQATQQNAALVEESAAAAESLKIQARQLVDAVAVFKIEGLQPSLAMSAPASAHSAHAHTAIPKVKSVYRPTTTSAVASPKTPKKAAAPAKWKAGAPDRRGPNRATNVTRPGFNQKAGTETARRPDAAPAAVIVMPVKSGTDDWESF
ncbi:MAG: methyl-accepting chemotaxis protein, partial [Rhizobacter sp.]|nr:methyl-accepting chemotaxis protein [Rhizobacter sp.]